MKYAGIGSRRTPLDILRSMERLGETLAMQGHILRSGGADGADTAFERGCDRVGGAKQIFLPWTGFNGRKFPCSIPNEAFAMAAKFHPAWDRCSRGAQKMHARNCQQILGASLNDPTDFIVCWSPGSGGTEQALRIARARNIPIFNLIEATASDDLFAWLALSETASSKPRL